MKDKDIVKLTLITESMETEPNTDNSKSYVLIFDKSGKSEKISVKRAIKIMNKILKRKEDEKV